MRTYLLPASGNDYKANLHCHSTISDGRMTVEDLKAAYMAQGYSIIAFTDHDYLVDHSDLAEPGFLPLNGYEMGVTDKNSTIQRTCHFCLIARDPDNLTQVCVYPSKYLPEGTEATFERHYLPEEISKMMQTGRDAGFFVTYNHPCWSGERYPQYMSYHGMHAMEVVNFGCCAMGWDDVNDHVYDDMIRGGERIFCIATDDNHNKYPLNTRDSDSFGGFTVIRADQLEYRTVTDALVAGSFYASQGPAIHDLYIEDGFVHITTSEADRIFLSTNRRHAAIKYAEDAPLTEASFEIKPGDTYIRLTVVDATGKKAFTNAYFLD